MKVIFRFEYADFAKQMYLDGLIFWLSEKWGESAIRKVTQAHSQVPCGWTSLIVFDMPTRTGLCLIFKEFETCEYPQGFLVNIHISFSFVIFRDMVLTESQLSHALEPPEFLQNNDLSKYSVYTFVFFLYFIKNIVSRRCFKPSFRVIIILIYHPRRGKLMLIALNFWCKA